MTRADRHSIRNAVTRAYVKHPCPTVRLLLTRAKARLVQAEKDLRAAISLRERRRGT
jgi:hypothetical protein